MQLAQPRARLDAELVDQRAAGRLVGLERVGLAAGPVERHEQLAPQALAQRLLWTSASSSATSSAPRPSARSASTRSSSATSRSSSEARDLGLAERLVGEVGQRPAAPQRERLSQRRAPPWPGPGRACGLGEEPLEAVQVELVPADPQLVARRPGHEDAVPSPPRPARAPAAAAPPPSTAPSPRPGPGAGPQLLDQPVAGDRLAGVQQQHRQQRPLLDAPEGQLLAALPRLERPQDQEFHGGSAPNVTAGAAAAARPGGCCRAVALPLPPPRMLVRSAIPGGGPQMLGITHTQSQAVRPLRSTRLRTAAVVAAVVAAFALAAVLALAHRRQRRPPAAAGAAPAVAAVDLPAGLRYDGGPEEGSRGFSTLGPEPRPPRRRPRGGHPGPRALGRFSPRRPRPRGRGRSRGRRPSGSSRRTRACRRPAPRGCGSGSSRPAWRA